MARITVVKKGSVNAKPQGFCPILVDDNPVSIKK
jgi:hypothetical protein